MTIYLTCVLLSKFLFLCLSSDFYPEIIKVPNISTEITKSEVNPPKIKFIKANLGFKPNICYRDNTVIFDGLYKMDKFLNKWKFNDPHPTIFTVNDHPTLDPASMYQYNWRIQGYPNAIIINNRYISSENFNKILSNYNNELNSCSGKQR
jgi:hypothetical protein